MEPRRWYSNFQVNNNLHIVPFFSYFSNQFTRANISHTSHSFHTNEFYQCTKILRNALVSLLRLSAGYRRFTLTRIPHCRHSVRFSPLHPNNFNVSQVISVIYSSDSKLLAYYAFSYLPLDDAGVDMKFRNGPLIKFVYVHRSIPRLMITLCTLF